MIERLLEPEAWAPVIVSEGRASLGLSSIFAISAAAAALFASACYATGLNRIVRDTDEPDVASVRRSAQAFYALVYGLPVFLFFAVPILTGMSMPGMIAAGVIWLGGVNLLAWLARYWSVTKLAARAFWRSRRGAPNRHGDAR